MKVSDRGRGVWSAWSAWSVVKSLAFLKFILLVSLFTLVLAESPELKSFIYLIPTMRGLSGKLNTVIL